MSDYDDEEFTSREGIIVGIIALLAIFVLVVTLIFSSANIEIDLFNFDGWGVKGPNCGCTSISDLLGFR